MKPRVLVLLATYNGAPWLQEQVESVLNQAGVDVDILVSDDGSTDGTLAILQSMASADARIRLLDVAASTGSAGANFRRLLGRAELHGNTHVALCDQDDAWLPDKLSASCQRLAAEHGDLLSAAVTARWPSGKEITLTQASAQTVADFAFEGAGQGCTFVMTSVLFERVGAFVRAHPDILADVYYHDWLIYALARSWNCRWVYDRVPRMSYRQHENNDTGAKGRLPGIVKRLALMRSGWYGRQIDAITRVCLVASPDSRDLQLLRRRRSDSRRSFSARLRWVRFLWKQSRRKPSDRAVLAVVAMVGWI